MAGVWDVHMIGMEWNGSKMQQECRNMQARCYIKNSDVRGTSRQPVERIG